MWQARFSHWRDICGRASETQPHRATVIISSSFHLVNKGRRVWQHLVCIVNVLTWPQYAAYMRARVSANPESARQYGTSLYIDLILKAALTAL
jgi:hypothetical protein